MVENCLENRTSLAIAEYLTTHSMHQDQMPMRNDKKNLIVDLTTEFALTIIEFCEVLELNRKYVIAKQLLRSGTAIAANVREAQNAESPVDFLHKFKIAAKEVDETDLWIYLCLAAPSYPNPDEALRSKLKTIHKVISKIISTSKLRRK